MPKKSSAKKGQKRWLKSRRNVRLGMAKGKKLV